MFSTTLRCENCGWQRICGQAEIEQRLRKLGFLRRASHPPEELVRELLGLHRAKLKCDACGEDGLLLGPAENLDDADWQAAKLCEVCREPIPSERLEVLPQAVRCVKCQDSEDRGEAESEVDYCPQCGAVLELRVSRSGGLTRYKQICTGIPACRL